MSDGRYRVTARSGQPRSLRPKLRARPAVIQSALRAPRDSQLRASAWNGFGTPAFIEQRSRYTGPANKHQPSVGRREPYPPNALLAAAGDHRGGPRLPLMSWRRSTTTAMTNSTCMNPPSV
jgi:hypothetical protein